MADTGHDIIFAVESETPGTFTTVAGVQNITFPGVTRGTVDVTTLTDTARKFIGTIPEAGEVDINLFWDEDSVPQTALIDSVSDPDTRQGVNYKITFPGGSEWTFLAIPTEATPSQATHDDAKLLNFKAKLSGGRGTIA